MNVRFQLWGSAHGWQANLNTSRKEWLWKRSGLLWP